MAIEYDFDDSTQIAYAYVRGEYTDADVEEMASPGPHTADFRRARGIIVDLSGVERISVATDTLRDIAMNPETQTEEVRRMRLAIVAPSDSAFGVSRIFQGFREEERTLRIFRSRLEAVQWLTGVPEGQAY